MFYECAMNVLTVRKEIKRKIKLHQDNVLCMCNECVDSEKGDKEEDKASPGQCSMNVQ